MKIGEKVEFKLSTKEAYYKLRVMDVQQERRLLLIQKEMRTLEGESTRQKSPAINTPFKHSPYQAEDLNDHARLLRLGERVTSKTTHLEWDKDSDDIEFDNDESKVESGNLFEFSGESEQNFSAYSRFSSSWCLTLKLTNIRPRIGWTSERLRS